MLRLNPDLLLRAYATGIFPMAQSRSESELYWIDPEWRGIIPFERFHVPRRLKRSVRAGVFRVTCDQAFGEVIAECAKSVRGRPDSWINEEIEKAYCELAALGHAHSVECWRDDDLIGGLYGVTLGGAFFGESMFTRARDASKIALVHLVARLIAGGYRLLDTQFITRHLQQFGAVEIAREDYLVELGDAVQASATFPHDVDDAALEQAMALDRPAR